MKFEQIYPTFLVSQTDQTNSLLNFNDIVTVILLIHRRDSGINVRRLVSRKSEFQNENSVPSSK